MPMTSSKNSERDQAIRSELAEFLSKGVPRHETVKYLAQKYRLSVRTIHNIVQNIVSNEIRTNPNVYAPKVVDLAEIDDSDERLQQLVHAEGELKKAKRLLEHSNKRLITIQNLAESQAKRLELFEHIASDASAMVIEPFEEPRSEAVAILQASDWHVGEFVHPEKVNYFNKYDPDIAEQSAKLFFDRSITLLRKEQKDIDIRKVVLHLGGDMMTGHIHEELKESVAFSPNEEAQFAKYLLIGGIQYWLDQGIEELIVVCNYGNHGRNNPEKKISTGAENSYEWAMYHDIAKHFEQNNRVKFLIPRGEWAYLTIDTFRLRFTHLDSVIYRGGVGGISIPLIKAIHNWNASLHADMTFGGHFHQRLINEQNGFSVNNTLMGINSYGLRFGRPTRATQNFQLLDLKRKLFTTSLPVICDDGDRVNRHTSYPGMTSRWQSTNVNQSGIVVNS